MVIRPIEPRDDEAIAAIVRCALEAHGLNVPGTAYFDPELDHLSAYYAAESGRGYFVAEDEQTGRVVGGAGYAHMTGTEDVAEVQKLYVDASARVRGIATAIMDTVEAGAREAGYQAVYLETHHALAAAIGMYRARGYRELNGPLPGSPHTTMDYFFTKDL